MSFLKGPLGMLAGAVDFKKSKVHMNMDIRVVDVKRAKVKSTSFLAETIAAKNITEHVAVKATDVSVK